MDSLARYPAALLPYHRFVAVTICRLRREHSMPPKNVPCSIDRTIVDSLNYPSLILSLNDRTNDLIKGERVDGLTEMEMEAVVSKGS